MWEAAASELVGRTVGGRYRLIRTIGEGGMGLVFEAEQSDLRRRVAVKVLLDTDPVATDRFMQEAHATANLLSPNIVTILDFKAKEDGSPPLIVMELLEGEPLSELLARELRLPIPRAVGIAMQMLNGLATAHRASVVHRDVKPANVFVTAGPLGDVVKLVDFGIAKILQGDVRIETRKGYFPGTPAYVAPEQLRVEKPDARTDIYGVGLVLYEMLTGRRPFMQTAFGDLATAILREEPPPLRVLRPDAPPEVHAIVMRALAKHREQRFGSADEMLAALRPFLHPVVHGAPPSSGDIPVRKGETVPMADQRALLATRPQHASHHDGHPPSSASMAAAPPAFRGSNADLRRSGHDVPYAPSPAPMRVGSAHDLASVPHMPAQQQPYTPPPPHGYGAPGPMAQAAPVAPPPPSSASAIAVPSSRMNRPTVIIRGKPPLAPPLELATPPKKRQQGRAIVIVVAVSVVFALVGVGLILRALVVAR